MIKKHSSTKDFVGKLNTTVINLLNLKMKTQNIYIGGTNKKHIREKHEEEFEKYLKEGTIKKLKP